MTINEAKAKQIVNLAKLITKSKGKDSQKNYRGNPLWHTNIKLASDIVEGVPSLFVAPKPEISEQKLKFALSEYIAVYNEEVYSRDDKLASLEKMPRKALDLHLNALEAAIESVIK